MLGQVVTKLKPPPRLLRPGMTVQEWLGEPALDLPATVRNSTVARLLDVTPPTVRAWRTGRSYPQPRHRERIALSEKLLREASRS
jgi:hypothetical protein